MGFPRGSKMSDVVLFLVEHPRDAVAVTAMLAVVYLVNAIKTRIEKDNARVEATLTEHTKILTELRIAFAQSVTRHEEVVEVRQEVREVKSRLERLEARPHGI